MTLTARACYWIACELVSEIRSDIGRYVPEPWQGDGWASFEFTNLGQRIRCVVALQDENDHSITVQYEQSLLRSLLGKHPSEVCDENLAIVRNALAKNQRIEMLSEK